MIFKILGLIKATLTALGLLTVLVLSPAIGSIASIVGVGLAVLLSPVVFVAGAWRQLRGQPAMLIFMAAFVLLAVCFAISAQKPGDALFAFNFFALLLAPVVYVLARRQAGERAVMVLAALLVAGTLVGVLTGLYDVVIQHRPRALGFASGGNLMGRTVVLLGFLAPIALFIGRSRWRWLSLVGLALSLWGLYLTGTRGVFIAVPVLGAVLAWGLVRSHGLSRIWYLAGIAAAAVVIGIVTVVTPRFSGLGTIFEQVIFDTSDVSDPATSSRLYKLDAGWHTFLKSPFVGFGFANFPDASVPYRIGNGYHNDFLNMAVGAGVVGIACWLAILAAPLVGIALMPRDRFSTLRLYCALILSLSLLVFGLTDMTLGYDLPTTLYVFLTAIVLGAFRERDPAGAGNTVAALASGSDTAL